MSKSEELARQRAGTVINLTSKKQETELGRALGQVEVRIQKKFAVRLAHKRIWYLDEILPALEEKFGSNVQFGKIHSKRRPSMKPDGGVLSILDHDDTAHPILISEVKSQG